MAKYLNKRMRNFVTFEVHIKRKTQEDDDDILPLKNNVACTENFS